jgi:hypothetical protein
MASGVHSQRTNNRLRYSLKRDRLYGILKDWCWLPFVGRQIFIIFTYPDGSVETINDRNRYWISRCRTFRFLISLMAKIFKFWQVFPEDGDIQSLAKLRVSSIIMRAERFSSQDRYTYSHSIFCGIRKTGPWVVCLSGLIDRRTFK